jgi:hypothetical protein
MWSVPVPHSAAGNGVEFLAAPPATAQSALSLDWLISPHGADAFFADYFEQRILVVHRRQPDYFKSLLTLDDIDRVLTTLDRRYPDVMLKNAARKLSADDYTTDGVTLDVARISSLFAEGATIMLAFLHTVLPNLAHFCRSLEAEFSCPFQTNIYLTPPAAQGAKPHYDTHDVFVLQVAGTKRWTIFGTPLELPLTTQDFDPAIHELGAVTQEFVLHAGDVAYLPRGLAHEARSTDEVSLHITAGILPHTWADLLLEVVAGAALNDSAFRKALTPGFARPEFGRAAARQTMRDLLARAAAQGDLDDALDRFIDDFLISCPPILRGQLQQADALERLTLDSSVGARPAVICRIENEPGAIVVRCLDKRIRIPGHAAEAVRFALATPDFRVRDLPPTLDDQGKLTLVRRLAREGLVAIIAA